MVIHGSRICRGKHRAVSHAKPEDSTRGWWKPPSCPRLFRRNRPFSALCVCKIYPIDSHPVPALSSKGVLFSNHGTKDRSHADTMGMSWGFARPARLARLSLPIDCDSVPPMLNEDVRRMWNRPGCSEPLHRRRVSSLTSPSRESIYSRGSGYDDLSMKQRYVSWTRSVELIVKRLLPRPK